MKEKTEILYGVHPVTEALRGGKRRFFEIFVTGGKRAGRMDRVTALADTAGIPVRRVSASRIDALAGSGVHQNVVARVGPYRFAEITDLLPAHGRDRQRPFILVLDGVLDPHNLGAIVRTAVCTGASGIVLPKDRSVQPTPAVSRTSAGAMEHARIVQVTNLARTIRLFKQRHLWVFGMDTGADTAVYDVDLTEPVAVVIGGEQKGIRRLVREHCDGMIAVPQSGPVQSLNASVAGAIVAYEAARQRSAGSRPAV